MTYETEGIRRNAPEPQSVCAEYRLDT